MVDYNDYDHDHHHDIIVDHPPEMMKMKEETKQASDVWTSYYEFIINEGSFKFWAAFQVSYFSLQYMDPIIFRNSHRKIEKNLP